MILVLTFDLCEPVIKMGLFDTIPAPNVEVYCKNKQVWEGQVDGTAQIHGATGS